MNSSHVISQQPKMTAINSCVEIDLTGQVVSDSIGPIIYSGVGGQVDFLRGASLNPEGKPILALPSRTNKGIARIAPTIKAGAGVVTPRALVHYVVTEYGIACLFGKTLQVRTLSSLPPLLPISPSIALPPYLTLMPASLLNIYSYRLRSFVNSSFYPSLPPSLPPSPPLLGTSQGSYRDFAPGR